MNFAQKLQNFDLKVQFWVKIGSKLVQNWSKMSKNAIIGIKNQMIPFFNSVSGTEYAFCIKISNFGLQVPILAVLGQILAKIDPKRSKMYQ